MDAHLTGSVLLVAGLLGSLTAVVPAAAATIEKEAFGTMPDGTVVIEPKPEEPEEDPVIAKFLEFLERDIGKNPQNLVPLTQEMLDEVDELIGDMDIDLDAPIEDD